MSAATLMSVEQFAKMPREESGHFELVEGELIPVPSGTPGHAWIRDGLCAALRESLRRNKHGIVVSEVDCRTSDDTVRRPDLSFITRDRWLLVDPDRIPLPFPPDIAVEVLSASESAIDVNRKAHEYLDAGTQEVWVIDSVNGEIMIRTVAEARFLGADSTVESPLLPGFSISVADVLATPVA